MLKLGEKIINQIYLGDKKIAKVFLGDKLVYQAGKPVFLDYIESDGNCYIDTNRPFYANNTYEFSYYTTSTENFAFLGCMNDVNGNSSTQGFDFLLNNDGFFYTRKGSIKGLVVRVTVATDRTKVHSYKFCGTQSLALFDETNVWNSNLSSEYWQSDLNIILFKSNRGGTLSPSKQVRILNYSVKDESGELVQDLRPCVDPKGIVCMYDMVTKKYFYNQGTGTLTAGNVIKFVDYINFDGASYIDTGINKQSCTIECTVKLESTGYRQFLCGWSHIGGYYIAVDTSNRFELGSSAIVTNSNATELSNIVAEHTETEMILTVNGNYAKRTKQVQTEPDKNYWLGNINSTSYSAPIKGQVYGHKFTSPDGVLIQDLRPCVVAGEAGFYDMVTGKIFTNAGTGTLKAGGRW